MGNRENQRSAPGKALTVGPGRIVQTATQTVEVIDQGTRPGARFGDSKVYSAVAPEIWFPASRRVASDRPITPLFSPIIGEIRRHIGELIAGTTSVFFLRDDKRGNSAMQAARDPTRGPWDPARAQNLRDVADADKPLEVVWEYEWFHAAPSPEIAKRLISEFRSNAGMPVGRTRLLSRAGEFRALIIDEAAKPEGPLSIDRYYDTDPMAWGRYDDLIAIQVGNAWAASKHKASRRGWVEPPSDSVIGGYNIIHGSTIRKRHFGDVSQRWHTGAMNIEPFYRRPAPGLGERLEYNFYLHPDGLNTLDVDLAIATGKAHPELRAINGFHLALEQMPGLDLGDLQERIQLSKTRRKFLLRDPATSEIQVIVNIDRIEAADLQYRVKGTAIYYDVDVSVEGDVLKELVLQRQQRFVRELQSAWRLEPNDQSRYDRAEGQLCALAERQGLSTTRFHTSVRLPVRA